MASSGLEWFRPVWRRVVVTGFCLLWSGWEWFYNRDQFWGVLTLALFAWAIWTFFISYDKNAGPPGGPGQGQNPPPTAPPQA